MSLGEKKETVTLIEWERKLGSSWSPEHLLPTDPTHFTDLSGQVATSKEETDLPDGYVWVSDWELVKSRTTEEDGWEYAWNVTASTWKPKDQGAFVRRRKWMRQRKLVASLVGVAAANKSGDQVVDLTSVPLVYACNASRSKREIAAMVGKDESTATLLWGGSTVSFLAGWSSLFSEQNGRTGSLANQASLIVVRGLADPDVLSAVLLPMLTESGEYRAGKEGIPPIRIAIHQLE